MTVRRLRRMTLAFAVALGCGDDGGSGDGPGADAGPAAEVFGDELHSDECTLDHCPGALIQTACACVAPPLEGDGLESNRVGCAELDPGTGEPANPAEDFCDPAGGGAPPDLGCFEEGGRPTRGERQTVTMVGVVEVFRNGRDTNDITIEVFEEGDGGNLGQRLGNGTAVVGEPAGPCAGADLDDGIEVRRLGFYAIPSVPTETPLIVKASGDPRFWRDSYDYGVYIRNDEVGAASSDACATVAAIDGPIFEHHPQLVSASDYAALPFEAGLAEGIRASSGIVIGEVRDCSDVRLEHARVGSSPVAVAQVYFSGDPGNPLPRAGRSGGTSVLGLHAGLDVPEGPVDLTAIGRIEGQLTSLGWYRARAFAGAVTRLDFRGLRPQQVE